MLLPIPANDDFRNWQLVHFEVPDAPAPGGSVSLSGGASPAGSAPVLTPTKDGRAILTAGSQRGEDSKNRLSNMFYHVEFNK